MLDPNADPVKLLAKFEQGPMKMVLSNEDLPKWQRSHAYHDLIGYINATSTAIQGIKTTDTVYVSEMTNKLLCIFDKLDELIDAHPPQEQPQRFGNKAYRNWARAMYRDIFFMLEQAIPQSKCSLLNELGQYMSNSFGNSTRIDYGTGHELSFLFFLCGLFKAEVLTEDDIVAAALRIFNRYLIFVRRLQRVYNMEPAGSQGVWSLDDYQFVPFIWGSAQLTYNPPFEPAKFLDEDIVTKYKDQYMFIGCIDYISKVKTGHFGEHSNQLWGITAVPSWIKINSGLVKMYQKEILAKFPVIQHVYFAELMSFEALPPGTPHVTARLGYLSTFQTPRMPPPAPPAATMRTAATSLVETYGSLSSVSALSSESTTKSSSDEGANVMIRTREFSEQSFGAKDLSATYQPVPSLPSIHTGDTSVQTTEHDVMISSATNVPTRAPQPKDSALKFDTNLVVEHTMSDTSLETK